MNPGIRCVQLDTPDRPVMISSPTPTSSSPGPISHRVGTRSDTRPAITEVTSWARDKIATRSPVPSAEYPSTSCR